MSNKRDNRPVDVLIIGAGMSGLTAAQDLVAAGQRVLVLDKGRGCGGRLATRIADEARWDHGAPCFHAPEDEFAGAIAQWHQAGIIRLWGGSEDTPAGPVPRWSATAGMSDLGRHLATGLDTLLSTRVTAVRRHQVGWKAEGPDGAAWLGTKLLITCPVPQTLALLQSGQVELPAELQQEMAAVTYERCLAVLARLEAPSALPAPGILDFQPSTAEPLARITDNLAKGISPVPTVTILAQPDFSRIHWEADRAATARRILTAAAPHLGAAVLSHRIHGWRYSRPVQGMSEYCCAGDYERTLVLAGDAFGGAHVSGAHVAAAHASGQAAASMLRGD